MRHSKANIRCILGFIGILLFASASGQGLDLRLLENINGARNTHLDNGFHVLSESAIPVTLSIPTSFLATGLIKKDSAIFMQGLTMVTGLALNTYLSYAIKYTIKRARPYEAFLQGLMPKPPTGVLRSRQDIHRLPLPPPPISVLRFLNGTLYYLHTHGQAQ